MPLFRTPPSPMSFIVALIAAVLLADPARAQEPQKLKGVPHASEAQRPRDAGERAAETDASRYCANVAPSIAEARIAWQTKRLAELDAQVRQRIADLEKAETAARDWIAKRDASMKAANDEVVSIYARMQPENAAQQISAMDDRMAAAILGKLKPAAASAILDEMEAERASRLAGMIAGPAGKKS